MNKKTIIIGTNFIFLLILSCLGIFVFVNNLSENNSKLTYLYSILNIADYSYYQDRGVIAQQIDETEFMIIISMGSKPNSGYDFEFVEVDIDKKKNVTITIREIETAPNIAVNDVITYPVRAISLSGKPNKVVVQTVDGVRYPNLNF